MQRKRNGRRAVLTALRRAMQFGVGSALVFQEKTEEFVKQAFERGQEAQEEGKQLVQEMRAERKQTRPQTIDALDVRINNALERLNVPSQKDISELNQHITELAQRIDQLISDT
jgi:polyhydroxyalkanoate synthesis regulator phasin